MNNRTMDLMRGRITQSSTFAAERNTLAQPSSLPIILFIGPLVTKRQLEICGHLSNISLPELDGMVTQHVLGFFLSESINVLKTTTIHRG